jgi:hypothetical protein
LTRLGLIQVGLIQVGLIQVGLIQFGLIQVKSGAATTWYHGAMNVIYRCPRTGMKVQLALKRPRAEEKAEIYEAILCAACTQLHFVHRATGDLLGQDKD